jgi:hypothetical protein
MYQIKMTPRHPEGYPRFCKDRRAALTDPFLMRVSVGGRFWKEPDLGRAQETLAYMRSLQGGLSRYSLDLQIVS